MAGSELPSREELRARVGTTLRGKWRLDELLDVGGMAAIYAATHRDGARGAIKVLHEKYADNADICQRFLREGYVSNAVDHPGAVSVVDDSRTDDGAPFLVMELLVGTSLHDRLEDRGRLGTEEVLYILDQVLDVLIAAHEKGIVHRDVKPANVFLTREGRVKLLDFGLARMREPNSGIDPTREGMVLGTPSFSAPEQARGQNDLVDWRTDLWATGALAYTALTGKYVHDEDSSTRRLIAAATKPAPSLTKLLPDAPSGLVELVDTALSFEKERRYQTAKLMQEATRRVYYKLSGGQEPTSEINTDRLSWTGTPPSGERRSAAAQASVTLVSPQDSGNSTASIDVVFEQSSVEVVEVPKHELPESTLASGAPATEPDGNAGPTDAPDYVTPSMIIEPEVSTKEEPNTAPTAPPTLEKKR